MLDLIVHKRRIKTLHSYRSINKFLDVDVLNNVVVAVYGVSSEK